MLVLAASIAHAEPRPPMVVEPTDPTWNHQLENSRKMYTGGMLTGAAGAGVIVLGTGAALALLFSGASGDTALLTLAGSVVVGVVAIEVGAPVALVGARHERTALKRLGVAPAVGGTTASDVGWGFYAGQILFPPSLIGGYVGAAVQHHDNTVLGGASIVPAVGVRGSF